MKSKYRLITELSNTTSDTTNDTTSDGNETKMRVY